jgi:hypothetical protein
MSMGGSTCGIRDICDLIKLDGVKRSCLLGLVGGGFIAFSLDSLLFLLLVVLVLQVICC